MSNFTSIFVMLMHNSQIPYNQLMPLQSHILRPKGKHRDFELNCLRSLEFLNGFLLAADDSSIRNFLRLMRLADLKSSLELEKVPVSLLRLLEGLGSENMLNDEHISSVLNYMNGLTDINNLNLQALMPIELKPIDKGAEQIRERKDANIKSYFTNLTLYTPPIASSILKELRTDLDQALRNTDFQDNVRAIAMIHFQIRTVAPFNAFNGLVARSYNSLALPYLGLNYDFLPLSTILLKKKEKYQSLVRECLMQNDFEEWQNFIMDACAEAARLIPTQVRKFLRLKTQTSDMIAKYTEYNLPLELVNCLLDMPFVKASQIMKQTDCHRQTAYTYLKHLVKMGILIVRRTGREKLYLHKAYFDLINE